MSPHPAATRSAPQAAAVTIVGFCVVGALAGVVWPLLAEPANYTVTESGVRLGEAEAAKQFGVTVAYAAIGALAAVCWGGFCAYRYAARGWPHVLVTLAGAAVAALLARRLGVLLGPPDPSTVVGSTSPGEHVPMQLDVNSYGVLLVWPVAALVGLLVVLIWLAPVEPSESSESAPGDPSSH